MQRVPRGGVEWDAVESSLLSPLGFQNLFEFRGESGEFLLRRVPDDPYVYPEVFVDYEVAHPPHLGPGDLRVLVLYPLRYVAGGLAYDSEVADQGVLDQFALAELSLVHPFSIAPYPVYGLEDVFEADLPISLRPQLWPPRVSLPVAGA